MTFHDPNPQDEIDTPLTKEELEQMQQQYGNPPTSQPQQPPNLPPRQAPYRAADAPKKRRLLLWVLAFLVVAVLIVVVLVLNQPTDAPTQVGQQQAANTLAAATQQPTLTPSATPLPGLAANQIAATNAVNQNATANAAFVANAIATQNKALTPTAAPSLTPVPKVSATPVPATATVAATVQAQAAVPTQDGKEAERQGAKPYALSCSVQKSVVFLNPNGNLQIDSGIVILLPDPKGGWFVFVSNPTEKWDWNGTIGGLDNMRCTIIATGLSVAEATQAAAKPTLAAPPLGSTPTPEMAGQPGG